MTFIPTLFPAELTDAIIDHLHNDKHSLANCALVCKGWVPSSRYHLFGSVTVTPRDVESFVELLHSPLSTITPHIHRFQMSQVATGKNFNDSIPALMPMRAVNPRYLHLFDWRALGAFPGSITTFGGIIELELKNVAFSNFDQFVEFMSGFSRLENLVVRQLSWKKAIYPASVWWTTPSTLRTLDLDLCPVVHILRWICSPSPIPPVHTLRFRGLTTPWLIGVQHFLRALGPSLQHLSLKYHFSYDEPMTGAELCRHLDLSHNLALRTIDLDMTLHQLFLPLSPLVKGAPLLLSQIKSSVTEEVILRLHLYQFEDINSMDWDCLEKVFALPQFSCLRRIYCQLAYSADENVSTGWKSTIKAKLPTCHTRGILHTTVMSLPATDPQ